MPNMNPTLFSYSTNSKVLFKIFIWCPAVICYHHHSCCCCCRCCYCCCISSRSCCCCCFKTVLIVTLSFIQISVWVIEIIPEEQRVMRSQRMTRIMTGIAVRCDPQSMWAWVRLRCSKQRSKWQWASTERTIIDDSDQKNRDSMINAWISVKTDGVSCLLAVKCHSLQQTLMLNRGRGVGCMAQRKHYCFSPSSPGSILGIPESLFWC